MPKIHADDRGATHEPVEQPAEPVESAEPVEAVEVEPDPADITADEDAGRQHRATPRKDRRRARAQGGA